jgi:hypothetical protein
VCLFWILSNKIDLNQETHFTISLWTNIYGKKTNSLPGSNFQYLVTVCINSIRIRTNSLWQTEYRSYLVQVTGAERALVQKLHYALLIFVVQWYSDTSPFSIPLLNYWLIGHSWSIIDD